MAFIHGKDTNVSVDSNDLSAYTNSSDYNPTTDSHDVTAYGASGHAYQGGLTAGTFTMSGFYDDTASTGPRAVLQDIQQAGAAVTVVRQPEGTGSGLPQDSFSALCTSYRESNPVADMISWTADFQISGAVTDTAQA